METRKEVFLICEDIVWSPRHEADLMLVLGYVAADSPEEVAAILGGRLEHVPKKQEGKGPSEMELKEVIVLPKSLFKPTEGNERAGIKKGAFLELFIAKDLVLTLLPDQQEKVLHIMKVPSIVRQEKPLVPIAST